MEHGAPSQWGEEKSGNFKTRLGLIMFAIYAIIYFAFIAICIIDPKLMAMDVGNLNLAIVYGFAIIVIAIIQALIYNYICSKKEKLDKVPDKAKEDAA